MKEQIYYNGEILTMENNNYVEAIFVRDGIIENVGTKEEILEKKGNDTEVIDLEGKTLIPAFIDPHSHITAFASTLVSVDLSGAASFDEIIEKIKAFKEGRKLVDGQWISGFGYDNNYLIEKKHPDKSVLDKISLDIPIIIAHASGHMGVVNSAALKKLEINSDSVNPEGGVIGRYENSNEPNGYLEENAFTHTAGKIPQPSLKDVLGFIEEAQERYLSFGITTVQDGMAGNNEIRLLNAMAESNRLKVDVVGYVDLKNAKSAAESNKKYINKYFNRFKIGGYKIFLDGSPQGKTAWLTEPYESSDDGYKGYPIYKDEETKKLIGVALKEKMQLLTHCNGDAAADQLINGFKENIKENNYTDTYRPVMIHAQTVRYDQLDEMKKINMIVSFFVAHTYHWGDIHIKNLGRERAFKISPVKTAKEKGVVYTLHQDTPVILPNMLETIWCAVNRITKEGVVIGEQEKVSPLDALKGVTINAAYQYFEEDKKGSIKEGKLADLVILDKNPLKVDPMTIKDIKVVETIKEGKTLYRAKEQE
ncbi:amidohydrolase [Clostridium cadaveris]|uniref:amidohydrolase n=1 Tax=Clostridium cadaveris TaxID=1529 RepID=UPI000428F47B|nr:amidohydrolase [Clostridium cadaveris]